MGYFSLPTDNNDSIALANSAKANIDLFLNTQDPINDPYVYLLSYASAQLRRAAQIQKDAIREKLNENSTDH